MDIEMINAENGQCSPAHNSPAYVIYSATGSFWLPLFFIVILNIVIIATARNLGKVDTNAFKSKKSKVLQNYHSSKPLPLLRNKLQWITRHSQDQNGMVNRNRRLFSTQPLMAWLRRQRSTKQCDPLTNVEHSHQRQHESNGVCKAFRNNDSTRTHHFKPEKNLCYSDSSNVDVNSVKQLRPTTIPIKHKRLDDLSQTTDSSSTLPMHQLSCKLPVSRRRSTSLTSAVDKRQKCTSQSEVNGPLVSQLSVSPSIVSDRKKRVNQKAERRVARTVGIVVGCFVFCWMPFFTCYTLQGLNIMSVPLPLFDVFFWLGYANSAINPILYALLSRELRAGFLSILHVRGSGRYNPYCQSNSRSNELSRRTNPQRILVRAPTQQHRIVTHYEVLTLKQTAMMTDEHAYRHKSMSAQVSTANNYHQPKLSITSMQADI